MLRLYLVRHGETDWNTEGRLQGQSDTPLSPAGIAQAYKLAARLARESIDAIWSSDLQRARQTAEIIAKPHGLEVNVSPVLREASFGLWEGLTESEILERGDEELWRSYRANSVKHRPPEGELLEEICERMLGIVNRIKSAHPSGTVIVVGHGGSLRAILCDALGSPIPAWRRLSLSNACLNLIEYWDSGPIVKLLNDTCHLRMPGEPGP